MPNFIEITLSNGEKRHLHAPSQIGSGMVKEAVVRIAAQDDGWVATAENTLVHVEHIVEARFVQPDEHPSPLAEHV